MKCNSNDSPVSVGDQVVVVAVSRGDFPAESEVMVSSGQLKADHTPL